VIPQSLQAGHKAAGSFQNVWYRSQMCGTGLKCVVQSCDFSRSAGPAKIRSQNESTSYGGLCLQRPNAMYENGPGVSSCLLAALTEHHQLRNISTAQRHDSISSVEGCAGYELAQH